MSATDVHVDFNSEDDTITEQERQYAELYEPKLEKSHGSN